MKKSSRFSPEVRERAVRLVLEHQGEHESEWAAICSIAGKMGCTAETLPKWLHRTEGDEGQRGAQGLAATGTRRHPRWLGAQSSA